MIHRFSKLIYSIFFLFALPKNGYGSENKTTYDTVWVNLAFECCDCGYKAKNITHKRQYSLCSDGFEQYYQLFPSFVQIDFKNFKSSYNNPIYYFDLNGELNVDTIFDKVEVITKMVENKNLVSFYDGRLKRLVNNRLKKVNKELANFDGKFYYGLFKVQLVHQTIQEVDKFLPFYGFSTDRKKGNFTTIKGFPIVDILNIEPISKEEYLKGG